MTEPSTVAVPSGDGVPRVTTTGSPSGFRSLSSTSTSTGVSPSVATSSSTATKRPSTTVTVTVATAVSSPSVMVYVNVVSPTNPGVGVNRTRSPTIDTLPPVAGWVTETREIVSPLRSVSSSRTAMSTAVSVLVRALSSFATGAALRTVTNTVPVTLSVPSVIVYSNVSSPRYPGSGV